MHLYVRTYLLEYDNALPEEPLCDFGRNEEVPLGRVQQMQLDIPEGEQRVIEVHSERLCTCVLHAHTSSSFFPLSFVEAHHHHRLNKTSLAFPPFLDLQREKICLNVKK